MVCSIPVVMLKCWSCQSLLFCGGNASKVFARYKAALVSEIIIAFQSASKCFAGTAQKLSVLAFSFRYEFLLFVLDVFRFNPTVLYLGGTCPKRTGFNAISVCSILALWKFSDALPFLHGLMEFLLAFLYLFKLKAMIRSGFTLCFCERSNYPTLKNGRAEVKVELIHPWDSTGEEVWTSTPLLVPGKT